MDSKVHDLLEVIVILDKPEESDWRIKKTVDDAHLNAICAEGVKT